MKDYLPPLKSLQFFVVAAKLGSFKKAAEALHVTQAAVSQQIKQLEAHLDMRLFERNNRKTQLTAAGKKMLPYIDQGFVQIKQGLSQVSGDEYPNVLRISAIHSFTSLWLLPRLQSFQDLHPELTVQLAPNNKLVDFEQDDVDMAIRMGKGDYTGLVSKLLMQDQLIMVASPRLIDEQRIKDPEHIFSLPWIEDTSRDVVPIFEKLCEQHNVNPRKVKSVIKANDSVILIDNALAARGVLLVNKSLVLEPLSTGNLGRLMDFTFPSPYSLFLVAPEHHLHWPKVEQFEEWITPLIARTYNQLLDD